MIQNDIIPSDDNPPQPWAGLDQLLNSAHAQLVASQDSDLLNLLQSVPATVMVIYGHMDEWMTKMLRESHLASTFETIWSLNQAVDPNWTLFRFSAVTWAQVSSGVLSTAPMYVINAKFENKPSEIPIPMSWQNIPKSRYHKINVILVVFQAVTCQ